MAQSLAPWVRSGHIGYVTGDMGNTKWAARVLVLSPNDGCREFGISRKTGYKILMHSDVRSTLAASPVCHPLRLL
jgi:hypothetical protein